MTRRHLAVGATVAALLITLAVAFEMVQLAAASALLHPSHKTVQTAPPEGCEDATFAGLRVVLSGWRCLPSLSLRRDHRVQPRATVVLLHGVADNRASWRPTIERFTARGFEVIAYDSRAHGASTGDACTYGFYEKQDLRRVLNAVRPRRAILLGTSLGAAIALQEAPRDSRVSAVIAAETFSDLRTAAAERAPYLPQPIVDRAFATAEREASFVADAVSPQNAARDIAAPVLLIHGADDVETSADHSRRVYTALKGPKRLILVPGAGHNQSLGRDWVWDEIDKFIDQVLGESSPNRFTT